MLTSQEDLVRFVAPDDGRLLGLLVRATFSNHRDHYPHDGHRSYLTEFDLPLQMIRVLGDAPRQSSKHVHMAQAPSGSWVTAHKVIVCLSGRIRVDLADLNGEPAGSVDLGPGDAILCTEGHQVSFLEAQSQVLEIRQGPFPGSEEADRRIIA